MKQFHTIQHVITIIRAISDNLIYTNTMIYRDEINQITHLAFSLVTILTESLKWCNGMALKHGDHMYLSFICKYQTNVHFQTLKNIKPTRVMLLSPDLNINNSNAYKQLYFNDTLIDFWEYRISPISLIHFLHSSYLHLYACSFRLSRGGSIAWEGSAMPRSQNKETPFYLLTTKL
jgi:hypothetical protein